ncbi:apolipoprotein N-acyltransferase [Pseudoalteromonas piscicida]|uniref:apolipoprotein N-acyltransferase n=1 Tax=Pseudoalteromonas piscicida TaxID=43662 RepID=UPI002738947A|nr:apolipoprotein N-acyltransferase [Pseudoalteromonas piscicida]MDP4489725.1 apolipoprotein N-acyltransferase [Pseudoalteromonas piscicida]
MLKTLVSNLSNLAKDKFAWLALISGCALTFAYSPFGFWPIAFVSLIIATWLTDKPSPKLAAKYGFLFGFGWFALGISWVHVSIAEFGGLPLPVSVLLMALLCAYLAIYPTLAFAFASYFTRTPWQRVLALVAGFAITEWLRGHMLTGFPWLSFGYTLTDSPLSSLAPWIGEFGLTLLVILATTSLYYLLKQRAIYLTIVCFAGIAGLYSVPIIQGPLKYSGDEITTLLVQGNIKQSLRWEPEQFWPTMSKYRDMTRPNWQGVDLVVWPEAAIPEFEDIAYPFLEGLDKAAAFNGTALITGIPDYQFDTRTAYNTLITLGKKEKEDSEGQYHYLHKNRYQKHQLLPIGEFVPFEDLLRPIAPLFNLAMSSFTRGDAVQPNLLANGLHVLPAICYEIAFSELVRGNFTSESDILFTVSNDAWFGDSHGPHQHMQIARMRALELQRPLIRVTNNGITGVYDPLSKVQHAIPQFEANILKSDVKLISGVSWYAEHGNRPIWFIVAFIMLILAAAKVKPIVLKRFERNFL